MVAKGPVSVNLQSIFMFIPIVDLWAAYRIQKLRKFLLVIICFAVVVIPLDIMLFPNDFWGDSSSNILEFSYGDLYARNGFDLAVQLIVIGIQIILIRKWSKKWNEQFEKQSKVNDIQ